MLWKMPARKYIPLLKISFTDILWMLWKISVRKSLLLFKISFMDILQVLWKIPVRKSLLLEISFMDILQILWGSLWGNPSYLRYPSADVVGNPCEEIPCFFIRISHREIPSIWDILHGYPADALGVPVRKSFAFHKDFPRKIPVRKSLSSTSEVNP